MWTEPKNVVKTGFPSKPYREGQTIADIFVCISYTTGLPLFYRVQTYDNKDSQHNFISFEEAVMFCDLHDYWIDTSDWSDYRIGLTKFYVTCNSVDLENGTKLKIDD